MKDVPPQAQAAPGRSRRRLVAGAVVAAVAAVAVLLLARRPAPPSAAVADSSQQLEPPWRGAAPGCGDAADPSGRAIELRRRADLHWERARFVVRSGAEAAWLLARARACARRAGERVLSQRLGEVLTRWTAELDRTFEHEQLRLHIAIRERRAEGVERHAARLLELWAHGAGERAERTRRWLDGLRRQARSSKAAEKEES